MMMSASLVPVILFAPSLPMRVSLLTTSDALTLSSVVPEVFAVDSVPVPMVTFSIPVSAAYKVSVSLPVTEVKRTSSVSVAAPVSLISAAV